MRAAASVAALPSACTSESIRASVSGLADPSLERRARRPASSPIAIRKCSGASASAGAAGKNGSKRSPLRRLLYGTPRHLQSLQRFQAHPGQKHARIAHVALDARSRGCRPKRAVRRSTHRRAPRRTPGPCRPECRRGRLHPRTKQPTPLRSPAPFQDMHRARPRHRRVAFASPCSCEPRRKLSPATRARAGSRLPRPRAFDFRPAIPESTRGSHWRA